MPTAVRAGRAAAGLALVLALLGLAAVVAGRAAHLTVAPVLTGSMRPAFAPGDLIVTRPADVRSLRVGQVPVIVPPGQSEPYAHRIISLTGDAGRPFLRTKGDANPSPDAWLAQLSTPTVPVVIAHIPYAGYLAAATGSPVRHALLITLAGLSATAVAVRLALISPALPQPS